MTKRTNNRNHQSHKRTRIAPPNTSKRMCKKPTPPSVRQIAKNQPDRAVVWTISSYDLALEAMAINAAIQRGGYPDHITTLDLSEAARRVLINRRFAIATTHNIRNFEVDDVQLGTDVEVTFLFANANDAVMFRLALP